MKPISIIGLGLSPEDLTASHIQRIKSADILIGGKRHLDFFKDTAVLKKEITKDLKGIIRYIKRHRHQKSIVVLASGDPLFFGIGDLMIKTLGPEHLYIYPNISTVAAAFARIKQPWNDVSVISLHGKPSESKLLQTLHEKDQIAVFTDPQKNPAWLASLLIKKGLTDFDICVFEQLGTSREHFGWYSLDEASATQFAEPNLVVLKRIAYTLEQYRQLHVGMPDNAYDHQRGMITKAEIRAVTLSKLRLTSGLTMWDLGAGSGSISIEASLFIKRGIIIAIEKSPFRIEQIKKNKSRFKVKNLTIIPAVLPDGLEDLPRPDRIFIGGGGKDLAKIIRISSKYLNPQGIMVINTVLMSSVATTIDTLKNLDFKTDVVQMQVSRGQAMPWGERLEAQNPIWIISGIW
jgi:precorrin-6Y C5,15-methyltransferase (decarboxylating)